MWFSQKYIVNNNNKFLIVPTAPFPAHIAFFIKTKSASVYILIFFTKVTFILQNNTIRFFFSIVYNIFYLKIPYYTFFNTI